MARTFGVLERLSVKDFELVRLEHAHKPAPWAQEWPEGIWTLQLDGQIVFRLKSLVSAVLHPTSDVPILTERQVAEAMFDTMLTAHNNAISTGYDHGKETMRKEFRTLLGLED